MRPAMPRPATGAAAGMRARQGAACFLRVLLGGILAMNGVLNVASLELVSSATLTTPPPPKRTGPNLKVAPGDRMIPSAFKADILTTYKKSGPLEFGQWSDVAPRSLGVSDAHWSMPFACGCSNSVRFQSRFRLPHFDEISRPVGTRKTWDQWPTAPPRLVGVISRKHTFGVCSTSPVVSDWLLDVVAAALESVASLTPEAKTSGTTACRNLTLSLTPTACARSATRILPTAPPRRRMQR